MRNLIKTDTVRSSVKCNSTYCIGQFLLIIVMQKKQHQSSAVKHRQDWATPVCDISSSPAAAHVSSQEWVRPRQPIGVSLRPRYLLRHWPQHAVTYRKQLLTASPFDASCAVSDDQFRRPCTRWSLSPSSCHGWITAMLCWWAHQPTCTTACSRYSTLLLDQSPACDALITSPTHSLVSTGW